MNERKANGLSKTRPHEVARLPHASLKTRVIALPRSETNHSRFSHLPACDRQRQTDRQCRASVTKATNNCPQVLLPISIHYTIL